MQNDQNINTEQTQETYIGTLRLTADQRQTLNTILTGWGCLQPYYFTFGSDKAFPYQRGYLIVMAGSMKDAQAKFRAKYPDRPGHEGVLNCSDYYDRQHFDPETYGAESADPRWRKCHETIW